MTDTPTRAEVEALIAWLEREIRGIDGGIYAQKYRQTADILTALLPLAYAETGETWREWAERWSTEAAGHLTRATSAASHCAELRTRAEAAERRLAEAEAENARLRKALEPLWLEVFGGDELGAEPNVYADYDRLTELKRQTRAALSPQEGRG